MKKLGNTLPTINDIKPVTITSDVIKSIKPLGSPLKAMNEGDIFPVTITGDIEVREFKDPNDNSKYVKKAYFTTIEGFVILVTKYNEHLLNHNILKANYKMTCVCKIANVNDKKYKYCQFILEDNEDTAKTRKWNEILNSYSA